ncbi:MAG: type II toxin-antitoxin system prevent-host-death family antitoxin [Xanthomonadaceae bacterium]|nr:type II toxin-antitoxin system prevent-host-death family antitoxin [Xanthomonadaceae bacterium]
MSFREEVGAHEARTHLPAYLRKVEAGARFIITQRGRPVAKLIPLDSNVRSQAGTAARLMREFMFKHAPLSGVDIKSLLEEGRD